MPRYRSPQHDANIRMGTNDTNKMQLHPIRRFACIRIFVSPVLNHSEAPDHRELARLSASYARLEGTFLRVTTSFATSRAERGNIDISTFRNIKISVLRTTRSTCMPYPRRQRSS